MLNTISITDLKQNTAGVIKKIKETDKPTVVLQRSAPAAVILSPKRFEQLMEDLDDIRVSYERKDEPTIPFEKYMEKRFGKK